MLITIWGMTLRRREKLTSEDWRVFHVSFLVEQWMNYKGFLPGYETGEEAFLLSQKPYLIAGT